MTYRASLNRVVEAAARAGANPRPAGPDAYRAIAKCHDGDRPDTLSIRYQPDKGRTSVFCFKGCDRDAILWAFGISRAEQYDEPRADGVRTPAPILPAPRPGRRPTVFAPAPAGWAPLADRWMPCGHPKTAEYAYRDEDGRILYGVARCLAKHFAQWRPAPDTQTGRRWRLNEKRGAQLLGTVRLVPYRLPALVAAVAAGHVVFLVEGEKDADALTAAGYIATCGKGGCGEGWHHEYDEHFAGAHLVIVADRDVPGRRYAETVVEALLPVAASISVVIAAVGKDAADHLAAGLTPADFQTVWTPKTLEPTP